MDIEKIINLIIWGGISLFCMIKWLIITIKIKKYIKVGGKVVNSKKKYIYAGDAVSKGTHCKYHFEYLGRQYDIEDNFYGGNPKLNTGDDVFFYVSPNDPNKYLKPENIYFRKIYFIGIIIGIGALLLF